MSDSIPVGDMDATPARPAGARGGLRQRRPGTDRSTSAKAPRQSSSKHPPSTATSTLGPLPEEDRLRSPLAQLWLSSRLLDNSADSATPYRARGEDRPLTVANMKLAVRIVLLTWRPFWAVFAEEEGWRMGWWALRGAVRGVLPAARLWSQSRMLDVVQQSFERGGIDAGEVVRVAAMSTLLTASNDIYNFLSSHNNSILQTRVNYSLERSYLRAQLSLSIPSLSSTYISSLMYEAGIFAGFEARRTRSGMQMHSGSPFSVLDSALRLVTISIEVFTQLYLLLRTLLFSSSAPALSPQSLLLVILSLAPAIFRLVGSYFFSQQSRGKMRVAWRRARRDEAEIKELGRKGEFKHEVVLFGLKDWVLGKWDEVKLGQIKEQEAARESRGLVDLGLGVGQQGVETAFYVLLALRPFSTNLTLGSIRLYQQTAGSLLASIRNFTSTLESVFQSIFYLAAFLEATFDPEHTELVLRRRLAGQPADAELVDYEVTRQSHIGGMRIEAHDLGFTYPGSDKPVLHDINLVIEPGTTLAVVGFNGGGKTTLVKALMGLYEHTGTLLINDLPSETYDPNTLHKRTSCLFQDFAKYSLTLRENVGVGDVARMQDDEGLREAVELGGAEGVLAKIKGGLDGKLNRTAAPDASHGDGSRPEGGDDAAAGGDPQPIKLREMMRDGPPPGAPPLRGPGGPGRGGGGGLLGGGGGMMGGWGGGGGMGRGPGGPGPGHGPPPPGMLNAVIMELQKEREEDKRQSLSGGQWQRVALARVFLRAERADLVVFDEPSASLDPRAEAQLFQRIHALSTQGGRKCTTIYISHRFSTVRKADQIAVVEEGTIVEIGSHRDLMAKGGRYAELFNLQKEGFEE